MSFTNYSFFEGNKLLEEKHEFSTTVINRYHNLLDLKSNDNWQRIRNANKFRLSKVDFGFGNRNVYVPVEVQSNIDLQDSRGNTVIQGQSLEQYISNVRKNAEQLCEADVLRISELDSYIREHNMSYSHMSICEIGFRNPRLLRHYSNIAKSVKGYDISRINVEVANFLGYECSVWDLNDMTHITQEDNKSDIAICYHVLEHTHNPVDSLKKIRESIKVRGLLHIEIPIEPGIPRLEFGHLIALEKGDLQAMLKLAKFECKSISYKTHQGGPEVERIIAQAIDC